MEYTFKDVIDVRMQASLEAEYSAYKRCLELIDQVISHEPYADNEEADWEKDTRTLRALRGDISELYHQAELQREEAKYRKDLAEKDKVIEQLRQTLAAFESKKE